MAARPTTGKKSSPSKAVKALEYDAIKTTGRRRRPSTTLSAEHVVLPDSKRRSLMATVQDQIRNASVCAWMIRRHLDYVSKFKFLFRHENEALQKLVNRLFDWHAQPKNFDIAERFGREESFRMFEMEKVSAGDAGFITITNLLKLQSIEGDLIAKPTSGKWNGKSSEPIPDEVKTDVLENCGVIMDPERPGRVAKFCLCNRGKDGTQVAFDHLEPAENVIFGGYFTRFSSQVRGVSPLTTAINLIQDAYEGVDFNLAKAKVHAIFGIAIMRDFTGFTDQEEVAGWGGASGVKTGATENEKTAETSTDGTKSISASLQEIKPNEMMLVDMDTKGKLDTIESRTPSAEFREFTAVVIRLALLALDIPYSAYDSAAASFAGMIADNNLYEVSCAWKREKNLWSRIEYSNWLLASAWEHQDWKLKEVATKAGVSLSELQQSVEWIAAGFPWLQKLQEVQGDIKAISVGLDNPIDACKRRSGDFFQNVLKISEAIEFAKKHNVPLMIGEPGQASIAEVEAAATPQGGNK